MAKLSTFASSVAVVATVLVLVAVQSPGVKAACDTNDLSNELRVCQPYLGKLNTLHITSDCCLKQQELLRKGTVDDACVCNFCTTFGVIFGFDKQVAAAFVAICLPTHPIGCLLG